jgi:hypothetical protein
MGQEERRTRRKEKGKNNSIILNVIFKINIKICDE